MNNYGLRIERDKKGRIIPEQRIIIYKRLLELLKEQYEDGDKSLFMCNIINVEFDIYPALNTHKGEQTDLPELRKQRPRTLKRYQQAWFEGPEYQKRIDAVNRAIKLWEEKYSEINLVDSK